MDIIVGNRDHNLQKMSSEELLRHIAELMEVQLKEWDKRFEVMVMKLVNYEWVVKFNDQFFHTEISDQEIEDLRKEGLFAIDRKLWKDIEQQGLQLIMGFGNYLDFVLEDNK